MRAYKFLALLGVAACLPGQQDQSLRGLAGDLPLPALLTTPTFPRPQWFRTRFSTPSPHVELQPARRLADYVADGKLELSLRAYIELVMLNNTDIALAKLSVETPANAITRAFSSFDPTLTGSFRNQRTTNPTSSVLDGAQTLKTLSQPWSLNYQQTLSSGAILTAGFNAQKYSTNSQFSTYNPSLNANLGFQVAQPLLQGRGSYINRLPILIARSTLRKSRYDLRGLIVFLLADAENAYWDVIQASENLALQLKLLEARDVILQRTKKQVELGAALPLDLYQPQSSYASAQVAVTVAKSQLNRAENALRQKIGADLDPNTSKLPLVLTETVSSLTSGPDIDRDKITEKAMRLRPELAAATQALDMDDLYIKGYTNALRPRFSLLAGYTAQGLGGTTFRAANPFDPNSTDFVSVPGGIGGALSQLFSFNFPVYWFGVNLSLPIRDHRAAADLADAQVQKRSDVLRVRKLEQTIRLDVLYVADDVEAARASIQQAQMARDFAQQRFEAEQKRYEMGIQQLFFVLDAQTQLNFAENDLLTRLVSYRRSLVNLNRTTGELLEVHGVVLDDR